MNIPRRTKLIEERVQELHSQIRVLQFKMEQQRKTQAIIERNRQRAELDLPQIFR